ncbi:unnamed protein product, partial [Iphiclides podalirius]
MTPLPVELWRGNSMGFPAMVRDGVVRRRVIFIIEQKEQTMPFAEADEIADYESPPLAFGAIGWLQGRVARSTTITSDGVQTDLFIASEELASIAYRSVKTELKQATTDKGTRGILFNGGRGVIAIQKDARQERGHWERNRSIPPAGVANWRVASDRDASVRLADRSFEFLPRRCDTTYSPSCAKRIKSGHRSSNADKIKELRPYVEANPRVDLWHRPAAPEKCPRVKHSSGWVGGVSGKGGRKECVFICPAWLDTGARYFARGVLIGGGGEWGGGGGGRGRVAPSITLQSNEYNRANKVVAMSLEKKLTSDLTIAPQIKQA